METINNKGSIYTNYNNTFQLSLPLETTVLLDEDDHLFSFLDALEGVDLSKYLKRGSSKGRKGHDRLGLLLAELFVRYDDKDFTLRHLEHLCRTDIRYMYLTHEARPAKSTFERFEKDYLLKSIDSVFNKVSIHLAHLTGADLNVQYIDGTKFLANANKYKFVWRKAILTFRSRLFFSISESILQLSQVFMWPYRIKKEYCAQEIGYIAQYLMELMVREDITIVYGKGKRKSVYQRFYDDFLGYYVKLLGYEKWLFILGGRNSCTKTDTDCIMTSQKIDYYNNTGLLRPGYNAQIAVSGGIIVNAGLFQLAGDSTCFPEFMDSFFRQNGFYPLNPMADAGYGSVANYLYCLSHGMNPVMKYNMYARKNTPEFRKQKYNPANWKTDSSGHRICPAGRIFSDYLGDRTSNESSVLLIRQVFAEPGRCSGCPNRSKCIRKKKGSAVSDTDYKTVGVNVVKEQLHEEVDAILGSDFGKELKKQRSIQVEGAFGIIKRGMSYERLARRGLKNAEMEFKLVCLGYNFRMYHSFWLKNKLHVKQREQLPS